MTMDQKQVIKEEIISNLKNVYDPEIPVNIYDLGLIYEINLKEIDNYMHCKIMMTLTSPSCPVSESLVEQVKHMVKSADLVDEAEVELTFEPYWDKDKMSEEAKDALMLNGIIL